MSASATCIEENAWHLKLSKPSQKKLRDGYISLVATWRFPRSLKTVCVCLCFRSMWKKKLEKIILKFKIYDFSMQGTLLSQSEQGVAISRDLKSFRWTGVAQQKQNPIMWSALRTKNSSKKHLTARRSDIVLFYVLTLKRNLVKHII